MGEVEILELEQNASAVVADAAAGETVTIIERGRPVALLTAIPTYPVDRLIAAGRARPALRDIRELPGPKPGPSMSPALHELRSVERY